MTRLPGLTVAATSMVAATAFFHAPIALAGQVQLWACHGPGGEPLGAAPFFAAHARDGQTEASGQGCEGPAGSGGLSASFSRADPSGGSRASWQLAVPADLELSSVRVQRATSGFGGAPVAGDPQRYEAATSTTMLESAALDDSSDQPLSGELLAPATGGDSLRLGVSCALGGQQNCEAPPAGTVGVEISSVTLGVLDPSAPVGAVSGVQSPAAGTLTLALDASDTGLGLAGAEASLDAQGTYVRLGSGSCPEHPAPAATINLALGSRDCPEDVSAVALSLNTAAEPDGPHRLRVTVTDAAGNTATLVDQEILIRNHPTPPPPSSVTVGIGSHGSGSGVLGTSGEGTGGSPSCNAPKLAMRLASKPLRHDARHRPVLRARHLYLYKGTMTCLLAGKRVSAPTGTIIRVYHTVKGRTVRSGRGTMTVHRGRLSALLSYPSSTTIVFRYRQSDGPLLLVKLPIAVRPAHPGRRK